MSNFDDYEGHLGPSVGMDRLLKGDGWDSPIRRIFTEVNLEEDEIEEDRELTRRFERCECDFAKIRDAADELVNFLQSAPQRIPKSEEQLESFRALGGYASGKWSRYVRVSSSVPYENENGGVIHIYGCPRPEHQIRVILAGEVEIREQVDVLSLDALTVPHQSQKSRSTGLIDDQEEYEDDLPEVSEEAIEAEEERRYDERTFGELEDELDESDSDDKLERAKAIKDWQEAVAPEHEIVAFLDSKLELFEIRQLARYMPADEVASWVDKFGKRSMSALEVLRIGLGELSYRPEFEGINVDDVANDVVQGIRNVISEIYEKYEANLDFSGSAKARKKPRDDESDIDDDEW
ncbi:unannotated protein [freshwater metagenome]|uniref:Unannotated protein n=1 Tax=freshwater metagenome TaxID=449393 RepID=A0A6J6M259_9ZZZZ